MSVPCPFLQVRALFGGLAIKPGGVHLVVGAEASAAAGGMALPAVTASSAFVEFATPAEALKALVRRCRLFFLSSPHIAVVDTAGAQGRQQGTLEGMLQCFECPGRAGPFLRTMRALLTACGN